MQGNAVDDLGQGGYSRFEIILHEVHDTLHDNQLFLNILREQRETLDDVIVMSRLWTMQFHKCFVFF